jgi:outer membrane protein assembly factor BamB
MFDARHARLRRVWIPVTVIVLAAAALIGLWKMPGDFPDDYRAAGSWVAVLLAVIGLVGWLLLFSGIGWARRFAVLFAIVVVVVGTAFASIERVDFQGNLLPVFQWRWQHHDRGAHETTAQVPIPTATPTDFPEYRNRNRDGFVAGLRLDADWTIHPPRKLWQVTVGGGYSGISVVGPSAVTLEQIDGDEATVCYDADTGKERWIYRHPALFDEKMGGPGPRTNPTILDGDVYSLGANGHLARLDGKTGEPKWAAEIVAGRNNIYWGQSGSPLVYDRFVVVNPGRNRKGLSRDEPPGTGPAVVAYDRGTGKVAWESGDRPAGYSSPQLATIAGVRQVLVFDGGGLGSFDPDTGKELWFHEWTQEPEVNVAQPLVFDDGRVFISSGYGHGCAMLRVTLKDGKWSHDEEWASNRLKSKFTSPVAHDGFIYGIDEARGKLVCLDAKTGKVRWADGDYGNGQILLVGGDILIGSETGKLVLVAATPDTFHEVASAPVLPGPKNWNYLTVARGRAYVRNHQTMACYELAVAKD